MLPDSTVVDSKKAKKKRKNDKGDEHNAPSKKTKKKSDSIRKKPLKKKVKRKAEDEDYGSDMDLSKELYPMSYYIKDRKQLIRQMFASLKKAKVKSMLPDILKNYQVDDIEELCYDQVQVMSRKRIIGLINGKKADEISSSGTDDNSSDEEDITFLKELQLDPPDSTVATGELSNVDDELEKVNPKTLAVAKGNHKPAYKQKLEILELEMRARAIKKMLMSQHSDAGSDDDIHVIPYSEHRIEHEIRQHMACEQESTSTASKETAGDEPSSHNSSVEEVSPQPARRLVRRRTASEMEPGELSEEEEGDVDLMPREPSDVDQSQSQHSVRSDQDREELIEYGPEEPVNPEPPERDEESEDSEIEADEDNVVEEPLREHLKGHSDAEPEGSTKSVRELRKAEDGAIESVHKMQEPAVKALDLVPEGDDRVSPGGEKETVDEVGDDRTIHQLTVKEEGEASSSGCELQEDNSALPKQYGEVRDSSKEPKKCEDIFVDEGEINDTCDASEGITEDAVGSLPLTEVEEVKSELYEDVPSPGKYVEEAQVNVISQSTNEHCEETNAAEGHALKVDGVKASDDEDSNGLMAAQPSVTSTDSLYKCSSLNWSAGLDVNIDQLQEDMLGSQKDEDKSQQESLTNAKNDNGKAVISTTVASELQPDLETNRAQTPEITAQRYRSQTLNIALELIDDARKNDKGKQTIEIKTKIYSSASTKSSQASKSGKSKAKSHKSDKEKKCQKSKTKAIKLAQSSKRNKHSDKTTPKSEMTDDHSKVSHKGRKIPEKHKEDVISHARSSSCNKVSRVEAKQKESLSKCTKKKSISKSHDIIVRESQKERVSPSDRRMRRDSYRSQSTDRNRHSYDKSTEGSKPSIFQRLASTTKDSSYVSHRSERSSSPRSHFSKNSELRVHHRRSYSPDDRYRRWKPENRRDVGDSMMYSSQEQSRHVSHDDRDARAYRSHRRVADPDYVSPKRYRSEWEPASKVITLKNPPSVVKTYELVQASNKKGNPKKRTAHEDDRNKSPVRFPSPDIKVIAGPKVKKPEPLLVVLSD